MEDDYEDVNLPRPVFTAEDKADLDGLGSLPPIEDFFRAMREEREEREKREKKEA